MRLTARGKNSKTDLRDVVKAAGLQTGHEPPHFEVRLEDFDGLAFDFSKKPVKVSEPIGCRVKFRKVGSHGRFKSFVVVGKTAGDVSAMDLQELVRKYLETAQ